MKREFHNKTDEIPSKKQKFNLTPETYKSESDVNIKDCTVVIKKCEEKFLHEIENKEQFNEKVTKDTGNTKKFKTVQCPICQKDIKKDNIKRHTNLHELKGPKLGIVLKRKNRCDICGKDCVSKPRFVKHAKAHANQIFSCEECPEKFKYLSELARHVSEIHRQIPDGKTECPICNKVFQKIYAHIQTHKINPMTCEICNATLHNYTAYKSHIVCHRKLARKGRDRPIVPLSVIEARKPFKCRICRRRMATDEDLQSHLMSHIHLFQRYIDTRVKRIFYTCHICDFEAESQIALYFHLNSVHNTISDSECQCLICYQTVKSKYLSNHMRSHAAQKYHCEICSTSFDAIKEYRNHCRALHGKPRRRKSKLEKLIEKHSVQKTNFKKVSCFECSQKIRISHMRKHLEFHKKYKCLKCCKKFSDLEKLKYHEYEHDKKSICCPGCKKTFLSHVRLLAHLKRIHKIPFTASKACARCDLKLYI